MGGYQVSTGCRCAALAIPSDDLGTSRNKGFKKLNTETHSIATG
jgi:hypothetical protein